MRVLFDQGVPHPLRDALDEHEVLTAYELGWSTLKNGQLLAAAEREAFDVLVTTDQNLRVQQRLDVLRLGVVVLSTTSWPRIRRATAAVRIAVATAHPGSYKAVFIPR